eukprot:TRINITY_DN6862_c3_g1_i1.p1 TRINITY_DN6862_c3_g1~~TRINITY_DN6862_c3_g1_i1.p1  ORF type:complete len:325 (+),score=111.51 TRINITY_DN6862_c3_g1_i1:99-1073(+)
MNLNPMQAMMQQQMQQQQMQAAMQMNGACGSAGGRDMPKKKDDKPSGKDDTVFVGGLRKSTTEEKVLSHFSKFGQVDNVDIKRLPDGTSRGFAFVKFVDKGSVAQVIEAHSSHMIDNKWVDVKPQVSIEQSREGRPARGAKGGSTTPVRPGAVTRESEAPENQDDYETKWSENYLKQAAAMGEGSSKSASQDDDGDEENPMANMMKMMQNPMMQNMMGMMMQQMMGGCNPMMMGMGGCGGCGCGGCPGGCGGCGCGGCPGCGGGCPGGCGGCCGGCPGGCPGGCGGCGGCPGGPGPIGGEALEDAAQDGGKGDGKGGGNRYQPY